jgi:hypothetical protein
LENIRIKLLFLLPSIIWETSNEFPVIYMISRLYAKDIDEISSVQYIGNCLLAGDPLNKLLSEVPAAI